jgi:hypothetical protein
MMSNVVLEQFIKWIGEGEFYCEVNELLLEKYKNIFLTDKDDFDIINIIWEQYGFRSYRNGLFWLVNPDEYNSVARRFPNISETAIVFARTAIGNLFLFDKLSIGDSIMHLNVHKGERKIVSTYFEGFLTVDIAVDDFWKKNCYGNIELKVIDKHVTIAYDECLTFVPALALGGSENVTKMKKVKIKENLELLAQIYEG